MGDNRDRAEALARELWPDKGVLSIDVLAIERALDAAVADVQAQLDEYKNQAALYHRDMMSVREQRDAERQAHAETRAALGRIARYYCEYESNKTGRSLENICEGRGCLVCEARKALAASSARREDK